MGDDAFNLIVNGLFMSVVRYCIHVFGNVWITAEDNDRRYKAFTKKDNHRLQVLENRVLRMKLNQSDNSNTSCKDLVRMTGDMSIHQLMAYFTLLQMHKTVTTQKPSYLANKLVLRKPTVDERVFPHRQLNCINLDDRNMTISRSGFICRGAKLWNLLPLELRCKEKSNSFKSGVKQWIKEYVSVKSP